MSYMKHNCKSLRGSELLKKGSSEDCRKTAALLERQRFRRVQNTTEVYDLLLWATIYYKQKVVEQ